MSLRRAFTAHFNFIANSGGANKAGPNRDGIVIFVQEKGGFFSPIGDVIGAAIHPNP